jgi:hypothetical protein
MHLPSSDCPRLHEQPSICFCMTGSYRMAYQTTLGWSLPTSGFVTLLHFVLPGESRWWGIGLVLARLVILYIRRDDVSDDTGGILTSRRTDPVHDGESGRPNQTELLKVSSESGTAEISS